MLTCAGVISAGVTERNSSDVEVTFMFPSPPFLLMGEQNIALRPPTVARLVLEDQE